MIQEIMLNESFNGTQDDYDAIRIAIEKLSSASESQFDEMKSEKWYNRVFDMLTFSKKNEKRLAEQIGNLAQAQQIFIELLLRLSSNDANISTMVVKSMEDIRKIQGQNLYLLERIKKIEDRALGIRPEMDINALSDRNKEILTACLYKVGSQFSVASIEQQEYMNSVISYLGKNTQMDNPLIALQDMDDNSRKIVLACCMECMYLKEKAEESYKVYEDFINEFDLGNKTIKNIKIQIEELYLARGVQGFYAKYKVDAYETIPEVFVFEFDDDYYDMSESNVREVVEISSMLQIKQGEKKTFVNKEIHFKSFVNCEGSLEFDNCVLYYNENGNTDEITLAKKSELVIRNSEIICKGYDETFFITCGTDVSIRFENTSFKDCAYFISNRHYSGGELYFKMLNCNLYNCYDKLIYMQYSSDKSVFEIIGNTIIQNDMADFYKNYKVRDVILIKVDADYGAKVKFKDNKIEENPDYFKIKVNEEDRYTLYDNVFYFNVFYFDCDNSIVENSEFINITSAIKSSSVNGCVFRDCFGAIKTTTSYKRNSSEIDNCIFENCTKVLLVDTNTIVRNCKFNSCCNELIEPMLLSSGIYIEFCEFNNVKITDSKIGIKFTGGRKNDKINYIKKCIFNGCDIDTGFLIAPRYLSTDHDKIMGEIENCDFKDCSTRRQSGKIIKQYIQYDTLFKKNQDFQTIRISNCRGLDKVIKLENESANTSIPTGTAKGRGFIRFF